jgi:hypothetical protein
MTAVRAGVVLLASLAIAVAAAGCGGSGDSLSPAERGRADTAWKTLARTCRQVAGTTEFAHGGFTGPADAKRHAAERRAVDVLLAMYQAKPNAGYAPPGDRAQPLRSVLGDLSKAMLFCDSLSAAKIAQALESGKAS